MRMKIYNGKTRRYISGEKWESDSLRECPFCGNKAVISKGYDSDGKCFTSFWFVTCVECGCKSPSHDHYKGEEKAIEQIIDSWNRRFKPLNP